MEPAKTKGKSVIKATDTDKPVHIEKRGTSTTVAPENVVQEGGERKVKEKEKKEKKKPVEDAGKGANKAPADDSGPPVPSMIDLRVGHIVDGTLPCLCALSNLELIKR